MRTLEYAKAVYPMALLEELQQAGLPAAGVRPGLTPADPVVVGLDVAEDDASWDAATDAVLAAHDPSAIAAAAQTARHTYDDAVALLKQYRHAASPTQAQTVSATRAIIDVLKKQNADLRELGEGTP